MRILHRATLALFLSLASVTPSLAAILWVGAEDMEFTANGAAVLDQTATHFRSGFGRGDLKTTDSVNANTNFWSAQNVISQTSFWFHARVYLSTAATSNSTNVNDFLRFTDASGINRLALSCGNGSSVANCMGAVVTLNKYNSVGTKTNLATFSGCYLTPNPAVNPDSFDVQIISYGVSGTVNEYVNGTLCGTFTGDLHTDANAALNGVSLGAGGPGTSATIMGWSEIILATQDTRSLGLATMAPSGNGNTQTFTCTSGTFASVNAWNNAGDPQNCSSGTSAQIEEFTATLGAIGNVAVNAVVTSIRGATAGSGPTNLQHMVRTGGADFTSGSILQSSVLGNSQNVWATNPGGGNWTQAQVAAGTFNIGAKSQP